MKRPLPAVFLIAASLLVLIASGCGRSAPAEGWIEGEVRIGPVNPLEQPGIPNDKPYSATLLIRRTSDGRLVAQTESDEKGWFRVALPPGDYVLEPVNGDPLPTAAAQDVLVMSARTTRVRVDYDSGIR